MTLKETTLLNLNLVWYNFGEYKRIRETREENSIHCPKCNSTAITTGARGVSWFWGTIGSSKTVNRCSNCGYTWKPNGR